MMRVLHFYKTYITDSHGGVEQFIFQLVNSTAELGVENAVLTLSSDKNNKVVELKNHVVHRAHLDFQIASTGFSYSALAAFKRLAELADVIHYHFPWPFMDCIHLLARVKKPTVVTYHSDIVRQKMLLKFYRPLMTIFLNQVTHIVATSPNYVRSSPVLAKYTDKISVIPIGLDVATYPEPTDVCLQSWRAKIPPRFFLFVGVLRYYKGLSNLLKANAELNYPLVIVGSGPLEAALKQEAHELGLSNTVFLGALSDEDKIALLHLCYGFVFPSSVRSEAFGISLLEAALVGKPLISCEIGTGTTYINVAEETGLVVPPNDPAALKTALTRLWTEPALAKLMGEAARQRYNELFTAKKMAAEYTALYKKLIT